MSVGLARGLATFLGGSAGLGGCEEFLCNSDLAFQSIDVKKSARRELCPKKPTCRVAVSAAKPA